MYLPEFIVHAAVARCDLEVVLAEHVRPAIAMYAVFPSKQQVAAGLRHFVEFLVEHFSADPSWEHASAKPKPSQRKRR